MSNASTLRAMFQDLRVSGKFEKKEKLALLAILIEMAARLEIVEHVCRIERPGN